MRKEKFTPLIFFLAKITKSPKKAKSKKWICEICSKNMLPWCYDIYSLAGLHYTPCGVVLVPKSPPFFLSAAQAFYSHSMMDQQSGYNSGYNSIIAFPPAIPVSPPEKTDNFPTPVVVGWVLLSVHSYLNSRSPTIDEVFVVFKKNRKLCFFPKKNTPQKCFLKQRKTVPK